MESLVERVVARALVEFGHVFDGPATLLDDVISGLEYALRASLVGVGPTLLSVVVAAVMWRRRGILAAVVAPAAINVASGLTHGPDLALTAAQIVLAAAIAAMLSMVLTRPYVWLRSRGFARQFPSALAGALVALPLALLVIAVLTPASVPWSLLAGCVVASCVKPRSPAAGEQGHVAGVVASFADRMLRRMPLTTGVVLLLGAFGGGGLGWRVADAFARGEEVRMVTEVIAAALLGVVAAAVSTPRADGEGVEAHGAAGSKANAGASAAQHA